jgi:DNA-binding MarR family transcriptional regulator
VEREDIFAYISDITKREETRKILSNLHYTHFFMLDRYKKTLASYDLSFPQINVLYIMDLFFTGPVSLEEIKKMVLEPNSDVSRIVTRLAEKGFVSKVPDPKNGRKLSIVISEKGLRTLKKALSDKRFDYTSQITLEEAKVFVEVLNKLRTQ